MWLWCRPAATALIQHLSWEPPYAAPAALKRQIIITWLGSSVSHSDRGDLGLPSGPRPGRLSLKVQDGSLEETVFGKIALTVPANRVGCGGRGRGGCSQSDWQGNCCSHPKSDWVTGEEAQPN